MWEHPNSSPIAPWKHVWTCLVVRDYLTSQLPHLDASSIPLFQAADQLLRLV
jgi:hypothetical protein